MTPATQPKSGRNRRKQFLQWWSSLTDDRLGIFALTLFVLGLILLLIPIGALQGVGGIVFGTGLTVLVSTWSNRQQLAKDANLRRKTEVYGPLHAELQNLHEHLEAVRAGTKPYLQWVDVPGQESPPHPFNLGEKPPPLHCWSEFKADYRSLDFSERTRQLLNKTQQLAMDYNVSIEQALAACEGIFASCIDAAITQVMQSKVFQQWSKDHSSGITTSTPFDVAAALKEAAQPKPSVSLSSLADLTAGVPLKQALMALQTDSGKPDRQWVSKSFLEELRPYLSDPITSKQAEALKGYGFRRMSEADFLTWLKSQPDHDWFVRIQIMQPSPPSSTPGISWATWWLRTSPVGMYRPATLGWLIAGNLEQAVRSIFIVCATPQGSYPPPPLDWLQAIVEKAWLTLESHPTRIATRTLHEELFQQVSQAEATLMDKLRHIQAIYEGGPPPL
jgi:hypothetical protein